MVDRPDEPAATGTGPAGRRPAASGSPTGGGDRMDDVAQVHRALGRYPPGRPNRVLYSAIGLVLLVPGALGMAAGILWTVPVLVGGVLVLLVGWVVPATIVTRAGFRRGRFLREVPWAAVTTVHPPPRGGDVQVRLRDERVRRLDGVKADRLSGIVLLAHAATPATVPVPPPPASRPATEKDPA